MSREKYSDLSQDELLDKIEELEWKIVDYKKETKSTKNESSQTIKDLQEQINELKKSQNKIKKDDFLKDKKMTDSEKKIFEEKVAKGYDKEDAFLIATKESSEINKNQDEIWNNSLDGDDDFWKDTISAIDYNNLALKATESKEDLEKFKNIDSKVISGELKVIEE